MPSSSDLRERVIQSLEAGAPRREAAERFDISASSAAKWLPPSRDQGVCAPKTRSFFETILFTISERSIRGIDGAARAAARKRFGAFRFTPYVGALVGTLLASFFVSMWLIDDSPRAPELNSPRAAVEKLVQYRITNNADLRRIADEIGLRRSSRIAGTIDQISRVNDREVKIAGWLADPEGDATPLNVLVFVSGEVKALGRTEGERTDVTWFLGLAFGAEKNVGFQVTFSCRIGDEPVVVGVGSERQYLPLTASKCP